jgi:hypothetical protein
LREVNEEYDGKRKSLRLEKAVVAVLPKDAMLRYRTKRVAAGAPDAHVKIPHVSPDGSLLIELGLENTAAALASRLPCRSAVAASGGRDPSASDVPAMGAASTGAASTGGTAGGAS